MQQTCRVLSECWTLVCYLQGSFFVVFCAFLHFRKCSFPSRLFHHCGSVHMVRGRELNLVTSGAAAKIPVNKKRKKKTNSRRMSGAKLWGWTLEVWQDTITVGPPTEDQDVVFSCLACMQHTLIHVEAEGFPVDSLFFSLLAQWKMNVRTSKAAHKLHRDHLENDLQWKKHTLV